MTETVSELQIEQHRLHIFRDVPALIRALAEHIRIRENLKRALQQHFYLSLAGGSTPRALYTYLAKDANFTQADWQAFEIYFGDERYVAPQSDESNYKMAREAWLDHVMIPPDQIHPIPTHCHDSADCASLYANMLSSVPHLNHIPAFDLVLLGMGDDGHTASLFPQTPVLAEREKWVASVHVAKFNSQRITMTYPVLDNARQIIFLVTGDSKAHTLYRVMHDAAANFPVQHIQNQNGLDWYLDAAAAAELL